MTSDQPHTTRRTVVKGAAWSVPTIAIGASAPVVASSCDPSTNIVTKNITLSFEKTGSLIDSLGHDAAVTYTNNGDTDLAAGSVLKIYISGSYVSRNYINNSPLPTIAPVAVPDSAQITYPAGETDDEPNSIAYNVHMTYNLDVKLTEALKVGDTLAIAINPQNFTKVINDNGNVHPAFRSGGTQNWRDDVFDQTETAQSVIQQCETLEQNINIE